MATKDEEFSVLGRNYEPAPQTRQSKTNDVAFPELGRDYGPTQAQTSVSFPELGRDYGPTQAPPVVATPPVVPPQTRQNPADKPKQVIDQTKLATPVAKTDVTKEEIRTLEKQTNLTLYPYLFGGELARIKHQFSNLNINKYYLLLCLLVYGFDNKTLSSSVQGHEKYIIDEAFLNDFFKMAKQPLLQDALKKTPAWQKGCFDEIGKEGVTEANADNMAESPLTGPKKTTPSLVERLLNKIHPDAVTNLEKFCNTIRTRSYLSMPKGAFSSVGRLVRAINGVVAAFNAIITDIYNGIIAYVQQVYAWVNGLIAEAQRWLMSKIEEIVPLDLICLLLDTLQVIMDDINFFTSLFNMSGPFLNYLNTIQTFMNTASNLLTNPNPLSLLKGFLPPDVQKIMDTVDQIGSDPGSFMSDMLSNYGYSYIATALQGNLVGALVNKFGPQYSKASPIGDILSKAEAIYNRYGDGSSLFPTSNQILGPNVYSGGKMDVYGNPIEATDIIGNVKEDFRLLNQNLQDASVNASLAKDELIDGVSKFTGSIGNGLNAINPFKKKEEANTENSST